MEANFEKDETFLGRWLRGSLSPEESEAFKESEQYEAYRELVEEIDLLQLGNGDVELGLAEVKQKIEVRKKGRRVRKIWRTG